MHVNDLQLNEYINIGKSNTNSQTKLPLDAKQQHKAASAQHESEQLTSQALCII